ncbi:MAG TPA: site-specific integrase [Polyangia bacterium]
MGAIRDRMLAELELRGMAAATKKSYLLCCRMLVSHFMKSPELLTVEDLKAFLLYLIRGRGVGPSGVRVYVSAFRFLYRDVLKMPEVAQSLPLPRVPKTLPDVLSREEVQQLLSSVESLIHRTILIAAYGAGLRISEALHLQVQDIDSKRMVIHIRRAKGGKDRFVLLSPQLLTALRHYWRERRPPGPYLFPSRTGQPIHIDVLRRVLKATLAGAPLKKRVTLHSFRHSFATHLLEDGTDIRVIQALLGHAALTTTAHYTRVSSRNFSKVTGPFDQLPVLQAFPRTR